ncbi:MAG: DUF86 domain-containing protein [Phycisphaerales bacterium]|nr:DUF86 domain-containing protein [Phycisphaerales bacterium]
MLHLSREAITMFGPLEEQEFMASGLHQTSFAWHLQAIGEAAARISDEYRGRFPDVPWGKVVGTRHVLSHEYDRLAPSKLWRVVRLHLAPLIDALQAGLATEKGP